MSETISGTFTLGFSTPGVTNTMAVTSVPSTASPGSDIIVQGSYGGAIPSDLTGVWNPGNIASITRAGFTVGAGAWQKTFVTPGASGSYTLTVTGTGSNTVSSAASPQVVVVQPDALAIVTIPSTGTTSSVVSISGTYGGHAPTGLTGTFSPGQIPATITSFTPVGGSWSATVTLPVAAGTYTLTVTGQGSNTITSGASSSIVVSLAGGGGASPLLAHTKIAGAVNGGTSAAINTTGATILVMAQSTLSNGGATPTDSKGNTWTSVGGANIGYAQCEMWYAVNPTVGTGHTFTQAGSYSNALVMAFNGVSTVLPFDVTNTATSNTATTANTGSITPSVSGCLIVAMCSSDGGTASAVDSSFSITDQEPFVFGLNIGGIAAFLVQTTSAAVNPQFTISPAANNAAMIAAFKYVLTDGITISTVPGTSSTSHAGLAISGSYSGVRPTAASAAWSSGGGSAALTAFSSGGGFWSATVTSPATPGTYTLTVTGTAGNTSVSNASPSVVVQAEAFAITSIPGTGSANTDIPVSGTYAGGIPTGMTAVWNSGSISGTVNGFSTNTTAKTWSATVRAPGTAATYTLTVTATGGQNSTTSAPSSSIVLSVPSAATVQSFDLVNSNASGTSAGFIRMGLPFRKGDVPSGTALRVLRSASVISSQFDERTTWSDGSLKFAVCHIRDTTFTSSESRTYAVETVPGTSFVNTGTKTTADLTSHDFKVNFTGLNQRDDTQVVTTVGSGSFTARLNTHIAVATRREKYHSGAVCEGWMAWGMATDNTGGAEDAHLKTNWYADIWKNSDGSTYAIEVGPVVAQDWHFVANSMRRDYNAVLADGSTTVVSYPNVTHPYRSQWLICLNDGSNNRGRRMWVGGTMPTLVFKPDRAYWISTKLVPPYDLTVSYASAYGSSPFNATYVPNGGADQRVGIDSTGAYQGRGLLANSDAVAFVRQTAADYAAARINAHAGLAIFYHNRSKELRTRPGESADIANTVVSMACPIDGGPVSPAYDFTADGMPTPLLDPWHWYGPPAGGGTPWFANTSDPSHAVSYCSGMYLMEGERYHLEANLDLGTAILHNWNDACIRQLYGKYRTDTGGSEYLDAYSASYTGHPIPAWTYHGIAGLTEQRLTGWAMNIIGQNTALLPDNHISKNFMKRWFLQQVMYLTACLSVNPPDYTAAGMTMTQGTITDQQPYMDYFVSLGCMHAANINESTDLLNYGFFKANYAVNAATDGAFIVSYYVAMGLQQHNWPAAAGNPYGFPVNNATVHPKDLRGIRATPRASDSTILFYYPNDNDQASYPNGGMFPQIGDIIYAGSVTPSPDFTPGTPYYIIAPWTQELAFNGTRNCIRAKVSLTPGGSPFTITTDWTGNTMSFDTDLALAHTLTVAANPPGIPGADDVENQGLATLVMANMAGYAPATLTLINKINTYMAPTDKTTWPAMSFKVP